MKRHSSIILMLAAVMVAMVSCSKEEQPLSGTFTLSVTADKGSRATKDLVLDGNTLNAVWRAGETVYVYKGDSHLGNLSASGSGTSTTTLSGLISVDAIEDQINWGDVLTLKFRSPNYGSQNGTLAYIAQNCDYAVATIRITDIFYDEATETNIVTTTAASFVNQQSIVKFSLQNSSGAAISASALSVQFGGTTYTIIPPSAASDIYVAIPGFSDQKVELFAKSGSRWYSYERPAVTFNNGQYYDIAVKMAQTGTLPGKFTVNAQGKQVRFSQGNLMFDGTNWSFHANQYDRVFTSDGTASSYPMDLFTWGNIDNPAYNGTAYQGGTDNLTGSSDWGSNIGPGWRTLTGTSNSGEWYYLIRHSNGSNVCGNTSLRYLPGKIGNVGGYILFPDGVTINESEATFGSGAGWSTTCTTAQWAALEAKGCVFLPAAGFRAEAGVYYVGLLGRYWSSTAASNDESLSWGFQDNYGNNYQDIPGNSRADRWYAFSVRLVRDVN